MSKYWAILLFLLISISSKGTPQFSDILIVGDDTVYLQSFPFDNLKFKKYPFDYDGVTTSGCHREYVATWILKNGKLYLKSMNRWDNKEEELDLEKYFIENGYKPNIENGKILADWFTGNFVKERYAIYPRGKLTIEEPYPDNQIEKSDILLAITKGIVRINRIKILPNRVPIKMFK